jgi:hypothetical protein
MRVVPLRLRPGDDLRLRLEAWMGRRRERAGCLISGIGGHLCAGSLVRTTADLLEGLLAGWEFGRALDPAAGWAGLQILLAQLGAFSCLMIDLSSLVPLLRPPPLRPMREQREGRIA